MTPLDFLLPDVGEGLAGAEIVQWLVAPGDTVREDQPVVVVETDKAQVEIPSPADGTVSELGGAIGATLAVGAVLLRISADALVRENRGRDRDTPAPATESPTRPGKVLAAPSTRRLATELGVDLSTVTGSGPGGRVLPDDVHAATAAPGPAAVAAGAGPVSGDPGAPSPTRDGSPADRSSARAAAAPTAGSPTAGAPSAAAPTGPAPVELLPEVVPLRGLRRQVARAMTQAWQVPHITEFREVDATELVRARRVLAPRLAASGVKLTYLPLLLTAVLAALRVHPHLNARLDVERDEIHYDRRRNLGLATATPDGLLVPVVHDADRLTLVELARRVEELAAGARDRTLGPDELTGGTFTVSNFGSNGTWLGTPIIRPPEVGLVGFGRIRDAVVAVNGAPAVRPVLPVVVAADHRLNDGSHVAAFLDTLTALAADPVQLLGGV